jgi:hypothetical protein
MSRLCFFLDKTLFWSAIDKLKVRNPMMPISASMFPFRHQRNTPIFVFMGAFLNFSLFPSDAYLPKKRGREFWVYFRFLMIQNPTITATATITAAISMAISVMIKGASVGSVGSGSIGPDGASAGPTPRTVSAYEL